MTTAQGEGTDLLPLPRAGVRLPGLRHLGCFRSAGPGPAHGMLTPPDTARFVATLVLVLCPRRGSQCPCTDETPITQVEARTRSLFSRPQRLWCPFSCPSGRQTGPEAQPNLAAVAPSPECTGLCEEVGGSGLPSAKTRLPCPGSSSPVGCLVPLLTPPRAEIQEHK